MISEVEVEIFYLHFLSPLWSKLENFSAHHEENFLSQEFLGGKFCSGRL